MLKKTTFIALFVTFLLALTACSQSDTTTKRLYDALPVNVDGNPDGNVTLVEFFDYRCKFCKKIQPDIEQIIQADHNVRVVYRDIAILGADSEFASRAAQAAKLQGRYLALHRLLINSKQPLTQELVLQYAKLANCNIEQLQNDMFSQAVTKAMAENKALAKTMDVKGTPTLFAGKTQDTNSKPKEFAGDPTKAEIEALINSATNS